jgi:hypothetical protein
MLSIRILGLAFPKKQPMETKITPEQIEAAPYNELIKLTQAAGIKYTAQKKEELKSLLLSTVSEPAPKRSKALKGKTKFTHSKISGKEIETLLRDKNISKSEKMRRLYEEAGITKITGLAELVKVNYSFAYGVVDRFKKRSVNKAFIPL